MVQNIEEIKIDGIFAEIRENAIIVHSDLTLKVLSSAVLNGGLIQSQNILNYQVPLDYSHKDPKMDLKRISDALGLKNPVIGLMTGVNIRNVSIKNEMSSSISTCAVITAGLSNPAAAGDYISIEDIGTINIIVLIDGNLTDSALVDAVKTITEAKTLVLHELDIRSPYSDHFATGTTSDAVVVACTGQGEILEYAGTATELGYLIANCVKKALRNALEKQESL
ncbi:MAG: adenosylcobinamide amidohydrolase [Promethearchaeota archaeon]